MIFSAGQGLALGNKDSSLEDSGEILVKLRSREKPYLVAPFADMGAGELLRIYNANPWVEYAEKNASYGMALLPNDPEYPKQWHLPQINAPEAWDVSTGSEDAVVAVLDTGLDLDHPDLAGNIWTNTLEVAGNGRDDDGNGYIDDIHGWNFIEGTNDVSPQFGIGATATGINHGTVVAGIIGAVGNNGSEGAGVAWKVKIMPLRVLDSKGAGNAATVAAAIDYAIKNGAKILNLSFVGTERSITLERAIERAYNAGALVVVAAGNSTLNGQNGIDMDAVLVYPACSDGPSGENWVIAVAALDTLDQKLKFSNYGRCVDLAAPGIGIFSAQYYDPSLPDYGLAFGGPWRGTSMAAPQVAGGAALLKAFDLSFTNIEMRDLLLSNAVPVDSVNPNFRGKLGRGKPDLAAALRAGNTTRTAAGNRIAVPTAEPRYVVAPARQYAPEVRIIARDGTIERSFMAYAPSFKGGVSVATGDLDGDGSQEIITGAGAGGGPHIRVFKPDGTPIKNFFAFETSYRGGVRVAASDVNGDGIDEIVAASGGGRDAEVRIFGFDGTLHYRFFPFSRKFRGAFGITAGDVEGNGNDEIIVSAGPGGGPHVQIFQGDGIPISEFFAYEQSFLGGVEAQAIDIDGDKISEIAIAPAGGRRRNVKIFNAKGILRHEFQAYVNGKSSGVTLASFDFDNDGKSEIITGAGAGADPILRTFTPDGLLFSQVDAYGKDMRGGVNAAVLR